MTRAIQIPVLINEEEKKLLDKLAQEMKGTRGQVFRLALFKFAEKIEEQNATNNI